MLTINTNVNSLKLQRNLCAASFGMQTAIEKMSTGFRINSAADDAAGLIISKALSVQSNSLDVANNNAQIANNILNVADGALSQMNDLAMRVRDLAAQAANGGFTDTERSAMQKEANELSSSLGQLVDGTKFNEFKVFDSKMHKTDMQLDAEYGVGNWIKVSSAGELQAIASSNADGMGKTYVLTGNIDLSGISNFSAIGTSANSFTGIFDGNGYVISNLKINKTTQENQGLFGYTYNATIKGVGLEGADVRGKNNAGALVGKGDYTKILNCYAQGNVVGLDGHIGALTGEINYGQILNSYAKGNVTGVNGVGILAGVADLGTITSGCYSEGNVKGTGRIGGLIGYSRGILTSCYSKASVEGEAEAGGLIGWSYGSNVASSYATGNVKGSTSVGGLIGTISNGNLLNSYSTGNVSGSSQVGSLLGYSEGSPQFQNNFCKTQGTLNPIGNITSPEITAKDSAWFDNNVNQRTVLGESEWDYSNGTPRLKKQLASNKVVFQIGVDGSSLSKIDVDTGFSLYGFSADFSNGDTARETMKKCDELLKDINIKRGKIGASSNIINSITQGNDITRENLNSSKSRIQDADIAKESANMVKNQILENAATALLAQSRNISGNLALQLLGGIK